jgi:hypothetical protein
MKLFGPTGLRELQLVLQRSAAGWPPRLPEQPIFYPVLNAPYAAQIARDWNTKSEHRVGYVTEFDVADDFASRYPRHIVGGAQHEELWVPAAELDEFNAHIRGPIRVTDAFFGEGFKGLIPSGGALRGQSATQQFETLIGQFDYSLQDFHGEVTQNREAVYLHFLFWSQLDFRASPPASPRSCRLSHVYGKMPAR